MLVQHFLENSAARSPFKTALVCGKNRLTYADLNRKANSLASYLRAIGVQRQDRVAVFLDSSAESVISLFGILKADAVFLMLNSTMKAMKLSYILNDCSVKAVITQKNKMNVVGAAVSQAPSVRHVLSIGNLGVDSQERGSAGWSRHELFDESGSDGAVASEPPLCSNIDLDLATVIYTSGSTGEPKGVMLTHLNIESAATSITTYLQNREDDVLINVLPLSFDYGLYQVLMAFKFGGTLVLERSFAFPYHIIRTMRRERVTGLPGVPTIFAILLGLKDIDKVHLPDLRYISNTAAALPPSHISRLRKAFPNVRIYSMYGLTECKRVSYLPPEDIDRKPESIGKGMPNEEVWIVDEHDNPVGPGVAGELVIRGSNVMRGYWGSPEETARVLKPGKYPGEVVLYSGDLFKMDDEGYLYFLGRKDNMIKSKGHRVSAKEIEQCLCGMEGIAEAAVVGIPDEVLGQAIVAYVRCQDGVVVLGKNVTKHCHDNLEDHMVPKEVRFLESLPKTANGKVDLLALKEMATNAFDEAEEADSESVEMGRP